MLSHIPKYKNLSGDELVNAVVNAFGVDLRPQEVYDTWSDAATCLHSLWHSQGECGLFDMHIAVEVVVRTGTCYMGTRMLLFNPNASEHDLVAILVDNGYGFDTSATSVTKNSYMCDMNSHSDNVARILDWRVIEKVHEKVGGEVVHTRFGRLLQAMQNPLYQQQMILPNPIINLAGTRWAVDPVPTMCSNRLAADGGHTDCIMADGHDGPHQVSVGSRRSGYKTVHTVPRKCSAHDRYARSSVAPPVAARPPGVTRCASTDPAALMATAAAAENLVYMCGTDNQAFNGAYQERAAPNQPLRNIQHHVDVMRHADASFRGTINQDLNATDDELRGLINAVQSELTSREVNREVSEALAEGKRTLKRDRAVLDEDMAHFRRLQALHQENWS
tara:strand:+ start:999 stop:2168 length:1170 start_codon:yes stop_codon:yes gene_type:complete